MADNEDSETESNTSSDSESDVHRMGMEDMEEGEIRQVEQNVLEGQNVGGIPASEVNVLSTSDDGADIPAANEQSSGGEKSPKKIKKLIPAWGIQICMGRSLWRSTCKAMRLTKKKRGPLS
ncbi:hypothetical protein Hanom_Chr10g00958201 [Helianthus anomalus]